MSGRVRNSTVCCTRRRATRSTGVGHCVLRSATSRCSALPTRTAVTSPQPRLKSEAQGRNASGATTALVPRTAPRQLDHSTSIRNLSQVIVTMRMTTRRTSPANCSRCESAARRSGPPDAPPRSRLSIFTGLSGWPRGLSALAGDGPEDLSQWWSVRSENLTWPYATIVEDRAHAEQEGSK